MSESAKADDALVRMGQGLQRDDRKGELFPSYAVDVPREDFLAMNRAGYALQKVSDSYRITRLTPAGEARLRELQVEQPREVGTFRSQVEKRVGDQKAWIGEPQDRNAMLGTAQFYAEHLGALFIRAGEAYPESLVDIWNTTREMRDV